MSPLLLLAARRFVTRALHVEEENDRPPLRDLVSRAILSQARSSAQCSRPRREKKTAREIRERRGAPAAAFREDVGLIAASFFLPAWGEIFLIGRGRASPSSRSSRPSTFASSAAASRRLIKQKLIRNNARRRRRR